MRLVVAVTLLLALHCSSADISDGKDQLRQTRRKAAPPAPPRAPVAQDKVEEEAPLSPEIEEKIRYLMGDRDAPQPHHESTVEERTRKDRNRFDSPHHHNQHFNRLTLEEMKERMRAERGPDAAEHQSEPNAPFVPHVTMTNGTEDGLEKWAYVTVRPGAHMFWWLYFTYHPDGWQNRPIIIWLQGGPGSSSTGFGNFELIGPLFTNQTSRNTTWVRLANVLFIDNPVGAGYSYVDTPEAYTTDVTQIAIDLVTCWKAFLGVFPEFRTIPLYIFGESYGGKMGPVFAQHLYNEINAPVDPLITNLAGIAMGNSFVSPFDSTYSWAPWLYDASNLDEQGVERITAAADSSKAAADRGDWVQATNLWIVTELVLLEETNSIDFYHILRYTVSTTGEKKSLRLPHHKQSTPWRKNNNLPPRSLAISEDAYRLNLEPFAEDELYVLMNTEVRAKLGIIPDNVIWDGQSDECFNAQAGDFMKDVINVVADMATNTTIPTIVYQGQLDLICDTLGSLWWVNKMNWDGLGAYYSAPKSALWDPWSLQTDTFVKVYQNFKFYWNLRAGHMVPRDDGNGAYRMVDRIINNVDVYPPQPARN